MSLPRPEGSPLSGLRVLDLSSEIAGPYAGKLLVDGGANVTKVESASGDPLRRWTASDVRLADGEDGALFRYLNASKRSAVIDLEDSTGRSLFKRLAAVADLVIESLGPGRLESLGLSLEELQEHNPRLSLVSISAFGQSGPWASRPSTEFTLQAAVGSLGCRGLPDREPVAAGGRFGEWVTGSFAALGGLAAVMSARVGGAGQSVDVSIFESMLLAMTLYHDLSGQWCEGPAARSIDIPSIEPAADGWVGLCTITGQQWSDFCRMIGQEALAEDPRYLDGYRRMEQLEHMQAVIHAWTRQRSVDEIVELAALMRIPAAPLANGATVTKIDHFRERGVFVKGPDGLVQPRAPFIFEKNPMRPVGLAPALGEHSAELEAEARACAPRAATADGGGAPALAPLPLSGLRVVDLTAFWAGPIATCFLAAMGAEVIKVESIQRPDGMRFAGAKPGEQLWEWSPVFHGANPGKRDITLRLDSEQGRNLLLSLIEKADVVVDSYSPRVLENFSLGWDEIKRRNPKVIMMRMPAFGLDGPWRDRNGFAMTLEQASGLAWVTGYDDLPLVPRGGCDPLGGMHAAFALLMALEQRRRSGEGQLLEVPLVEVALNVAAEPLLEYSAYGELLGRQGNRGPYAAPQGLYRGSGDDDYVAVAVADDAQWLALCSLLGWSDWAENAELAVVTGRRERHDDIDARIEEWTRRLSAEAAAELLIAAGVSAAMVVNAHAVMPNPQLEHRRFFQTLVHPISGETRYPGFPMQFSAFGPKLHRSPPPTLGQHNPEVLAEELGLSPRQIDELRRQEIIGERPSFM